MQLNQKRNTVSLFYELERSCALIIHRVGGYIIEAYKLEAIPYKWMLIRKEMALFRLVSLVPYHLAVPRHELPRIDAMGS